MKVLLTGEDAMTRDSVDKTLPDRNLDIYIYEIHVLICFDSFGTPTYTAYKPKTHSLKGRSCLSADSLSGFLIHSSFWVIKGNPAFSLCSRCG